MAEVSQDYEGRQNQDPGGVIGCNGPPCRLEPVEVGHTASARASSVSAPPLGSTPWCRCSRSRWTTASSSSAGSGKRTTAAPAPIRRLHAGSSPPPASSRAPRSSWSACSRSFGTLSMLVLQAVRDRARDGNIARRHHRSRGVPARHDEAARRLELVPPALARLAPPRRSAGNARGPGGEAGCRLSGALLGSRPRIDAVGSPCRASGGGGIRTHDRGEPPMPVFKT